MFKNPDYEEFLRLFPAIQEYQNLATKYNIADIFQDNGGKYVQILILLGLKTVGTREGNDAIDEDGNEFEIKTVNLELQRSFTTHHHMNPTIIAKYRKVDWFFAAFLGIKLQVIYRMKPSAMEIFYTKWEDKWHTDGGKDINNPKIPLKYVMAHGELVWTANGEMDFVIPSIKKDPNRVIRRRVKKDLNPLLIPIVGE
jgi:hypothetical protein